MVGQFQSLALRQAMQAKPGGKRHWQNQENGMANRNATGNITISAVIACYRVVITAANPEPVRFDPYFLDRSATL